MPSYILGFFFSSRKLMDKTKMPLTKSGRKVLRRLKKFYGPRKGERIFYALIKAKRKGSRKWHA